MCTGKSRVSVVLTAVSLIALSTAPALAAERESATFTDVGSIGAFNNANNVVQTTTFSGGYAVKSLHINATLQKVHASTTPKQAFVWVIPPTGNDFTIQVCGSATWTADPFVMSDYVFMLNTPISEAAGQWTFRFFEQTYNSTAPAADSIWNSIQFTLDDAVAYPNHATVLTPSGGVYTDPTGYVDPAAYTSNPQYNPCVIDGMQAGETIVSDPDYFSFFIIKPITAAPGIYKYSLTGNLSGGTSTASLILLMDYAQNATTYGYHPAGEPGLVNMVSYTYMQPAAIVNNTQQYSTWYGLGKGEHVVALLGTSGTTAPTSISVTLSRQSVTPVSVAPFVAGPVDIVDLGAVHADFWLFDAAFNAIPGAGQECHDSCNNPTLSIPYLAPGTYYLAAGYQSLYPSEPSPSTSYRNGTVAPSPGMVADGYYTDPAGFVFQFVYSGGSTTASAGKGTSLDVTWFKLTVTLPPCSGDANCDGVVSFADINPFVQALSDLPAWQASHPGCPTQNCDVNADGVVSFADINPFVAKLGSPGPCP
jgi:hypothetical protein